MDDRDVASLVGGTAIGIMLLVMAWLIVSPSSGTSAGTDPAAPGGLPSSGTPSSQQLGASDPMQPCADADNAIERPLRRARLGIDRWEVHVRAMNKLVAGAVTGQQATRFWNRARVDARHRVAAFERSW